MYRYDVYQKGRICGRAEVQQLGLYWQVQLRCACNGIVRAFAENVAQRLPLGVLMPAKTEMTLRRSISRSSFSFFPDTVLTLDEAPIWTDFSRKAAGFAVNNARVCRTEEGYLLLCPAETQAPFACMPLFCFFALVTRNERACYQLRLDEELLPIMPEQTHSP